MIIHRFPVLIGEFYLRCQDAAFKLDSLPVFVFSNPLRCLSGSLNGLN